MNRHGERTVFDLGRLDLPAQRLGIGGVERSDANDRACGLDRTYGLDLADGARVVTSRDKRVPSAPLGQPSSRDEQERVRLALGELLRDRQRDPAESSGDHDQ